MNLFSSVRYRYRYMLWWVYRYRLNENFHIRLSLIYTDGQPSIYFRTWTPQDLILLSCRGTYLSHPAVCIVVYTCLPIPFLIIGNIWMFFIFRRVSHLNNQLFPIVHSFVPNCKLFIPIKVWPGKKYESTFCQLWKSVNFSVPKRNTIH